MCVLGRDYGTGEQKLGLILRPGLFSEHMRLVIVRPATAGETFRGRGQIWFDGGEPIDTPFVQGFSETNRVTATVIDLKTSDLAPLNTAKRLRIRAGDLDATILPSAVPAAMRAVDNCQKQLLVTWGMDASVVESIKTFPVLRGGLPSIFSANDYPMAAIARNEQGTVGVRFWVSKDGAVNDCRVVESSGSQSLDRKTCAIIERRARLEPARTASGQAVATIAFQRVTWSIPE